MATKTQTTLPKAIITLWKNKSKDGKKTYLSNKAFIGFYNTKKQNPKEPDLQIYAKGENGKAEKEETAVLWCNVSKDGNTKYLSGYLKKTNEKLTGFINNKADDKIPYVNIYLSEELGKSNKKVSNKKVTKEDVVADDDLPF